MNKLNRELPYRKSDGLRKRHLLAEPARTKLLVEHIETQSFLTMVARMALRTHPSIIREWGINE